MLFFNGNALRYYVKKEEKSVSEQNVYQLSLFCFSPDFPCGLANAMPIESQAFGLDVQSGGF